MVVTRTTMENRLEQLERNIDRVENLERDFREWRMENQSQMEELRQLLRQRPRRRRGRTRHRVDESPFSAVSESRSRSHVRAPDPSPPTHYGGRKLDVPVFNGDDAYGWLVRVERYFRLNAVREGEQLDAIVIALEGRALNWYQWWEEQTEELSWAEFRRAVIRRFQPGLIQNPLGPLLSIRQTSSVMQYREQFEMLIAPLVMLESIFINGLHEEIQAELRLHESKSLSELMDRALLIEGKNLAIQRGKGGSREKGDWVSKGGGWRTRAVGSSEGGQFRSSTVKPNTVPTGPTEQKNNGDPGGEKKTGGGRKLSQEELRELSRKGLCFKCGERWGHDHVCKLKNYQLMLLEIKDDEEAESEVAAEEVTLELEAKILQLSLRSKEGLTSNRSFKVRGEVQQRPVLILVDSGASSNFISHKLAKELNLKVEDTPLYVVEIGTGERVRNKGVCRGVNITVQGVQIEQKFFMMELGGTEMVLGMDWLASLGDIKANFGQLTIGWKEGNHRCMIKGDPSLCKDQASWKAMVKALHDDGEGFVVQYQQLTLEAATDHASIKEIEALLEGYQDVFQEPTGLPPKHDQDHAISLLAGAPIPNIRPYRYPHYQKNEIEKFVEEMLQAGIIRPSISPFSSPVILVRKKDGGWRFCVDYRALNKHTIPDKFPIPVIDELLDELGAAVIFSKLDLKSGYHQIRMREEDIPKTAFRTHEGHYEYLVMPFGLTNAPSTFQALMNKILKPFMRKFVMVFFDDILIYSKDVADHAQHLQMVLQTLREHHLFANKKKCTFARPQLEYLGHLISEKGVAADPGKIEAMVNWPSPKDVKGLRGFLGLTGYYRRFVRNYGKIAWPLTQQLKKDSFMWDHEAQVAFDQLKKAMTSLPVLAVPDFDKPFVVEADASGKGIGAVLMQGGKPVAYMSQTLSSRAQNKSVYERELMAIVLAVQKWRHYLLGRHFTVHTDQKSLKFLTDQRLMGEEQQKWISKLMGFDFDVKYKPGTENGAADALSRKMQFSALSIVQIQEWEGLDEEVQANEKLRGIIQDILSHADSHPGYSLKKGRLYYHDRLVIPKDSPRIPKILHEFHDSALGGHSGYFKTYKRVAGVVFWEGMKNRIQQYVRACVVCQRNKYQSLSPGGLLQPLPIPTQVWVDISLDFIGGLVYPKLWVWIPYWWL